jgi:glutaredoxin
MNIRMSANSFLNLNLLGRNLWQTHTIRQYSATGATPNVITIYTKKYCGLCEEAKEQLEILQETVNFELVEVDIEKEREWMKYRLDVPVIHYNGDPIMKHGVGVEALRRILLETSLSNK